MGGLVRPTWVTVTGWLCVAAGGMGVLSSAALALTAALRRAMAAEGIDPFAQLRVPLDPLFLLVLQHPGALAASHLGLGVLTVCVGVGFLRLRAWARTALEVLTWIALVSSPILGAAWFFRGIESPGEGTGLPLAAAALILAVVQCVACGLFIRFLRGKAVRAAFRNRP